MEQALPMRIVRSGVCTGQIAAISIFLRPHLWGVELAVYLLIAFVALADDFANGLIAKRIVELARAGERNPHLLCEGAIEKLHGHLYGD
jgi:hypothetical protein